jgi:hypothetical protein
MKQMKHFATIRNNINYSLTTVAFYVKQRAVPVDDGRTREQNNVRKDSRTYRDKGMAYGPMQ